MVRWLRLPVLTGLLVLTLTGCALISPSSAQGNAQISQASAVRSNPCSLLTSVQLHQLGVNTSQQQQDVLGSGPACVWSHVPVTQGDQFLGRLVNGPVAGGTQSASINNMPTTEYAPADLPQETSCVYLVTLASNVTLWAQYSNPGANLPGLNHRVACRKAQLAAVSMSSTYQTIPR
jgi:uncharacterized protein DUF3558